MKARPRFRKARAALSAWIRPLAASVVGVALVATGAWATVARVVPYVTGHDYFRLRSIRISSDETRVAPQAIAEIAGLFEDTSLWDVEPDSIRRTLREASWVREADVTRHFPWQVNVSVARRHGVAAAVAGGRAWLVDRDGVLFREVESDASVPDLPYLTGWDAPDAQAERAARLRALLGVLDEAAERRVEVSELHIDEDGAVWLYASGVKASVRLGDPERAAIGLERLAIALAELGPLADRARVIDTDYPGRIVIRGADDKLPALLAAHNEKMAGLREAGTQGATAASAQAMPPAGGSTPARPGPASTTTNDGKAGRRG